jgi:hypothetical protein
MRSVPLRKRATAKRPRKVWMPPDPNEGGVRIPELVKERVRRRVEAFAAKHYAGKYSRLDFRFRGHFCYIDAYQEPEPGSYPEYLRGRESEEEYYERTRQIPIHLCRLRYFGHEDRWSMAFYKYSDEKYELSVFNTFSFWGTPEEGFDTAAGYLR